MTQALGFFKGPSAAAERVMTDDGLTYRPAGLNAPLAAQGAKCMTPSSSVSGRTARSRE